MCWWRYSYCLLTLLSKFKWSSLFQLACKGLAFPLTKKVHHDAPQAMNGTSCIFHGATLNLHWVATLGVPAKGRVIEVGRSIEVCQVCRKFSYSLAETSLQKTNARGGKHYWSDPQSVAIFYHIFLHHILEIIIKPKKVYQALDSRKKLVVKGSCGRLIEVIMGELSLGRWKGGRGRLIEV